VPGVGPFPVTQPSLPRSTFLFPHTAPGSFGEVPGGCGPGRRIPGRYEPSSLPTRAIVFPILSLYSHPSGREAPGGIPHLRILATLAFVGALIVNGLANRLPLGGRTTGELSALYPNLFVPAGITFSIWGIIYLLVGAWTIVQFLPAAGMLGRRLAPAFTLSSILNAGWLFAWHHEQVALSLLVMIGLLSSLLVLNETLASWGARPTVDSAGGPRGSVWARLARAAFGIYLGWVLVATLVNVTVLGVDLGWDGAPLTPALWASLLTGIGAGVAIFTFRRLHNPWIAASVIWAFAGIALARREEAPLVFWAAVAMLLVVAAAALHYIRRARRDAYP
jgi:hypothetical protein